MTLSAYKLVSTDTWPIIDRSGIDVDPKTDTERKIKAVAPLRGKVLDICTGLGYTAIGAAKDKNVSSVLTIEADQNVAALSQQNKDSKELFINSKIERVICDAQEVIAELPAQEFDRVIHDPPSKVLATELYSERFYKQLYRVLKRGGKLFHHVGMLSKTGKDSIAVIARTLQRAGFKEVKHVPSAAGIVAKK